MNILIACEESQRVCTAFRERGHNAFSCDIQQPSGGHPEWHILGDVLKILNPVRQATGNQGIEFETMTGDEYAISQWDLIIAHPPCTYLTVAGAANIPKHPERIPKGFEAKEFFMQFIHAQCRRICVENPVPMKRFGLPKYTQIVRPWMFGHNSNKPVCLWLIGLPELQSTNIIDYQPDNVYWVHKKSGRKKCCSKWYNTGTNRHSLNRSKTFEGIAQAMAEQWGDEIEKEVQDNDER